MKKSDLIKKNIKSLKIIQKQLFFKKNIFKATNKKNVLISYIVAPIYNSNDKSHSNVAEVNLIVKFFKDNQYNVDIVDFNYKLEIDFNKYDVIIGFGNPLEKAIKNNVNCKKILYITGQNPYINNFNSISRLNQFKKRHGKFILESMRIAEELWPIQLTACDEMIVLGNNVTKDTFKQFYKGNIHKLNAPAFTSLTELHNSKDYNMAKMNFVWFGSRGAIHKGLDILIDIFKKRNDINLYICSDLEKEREFFELYKNEITKRENIFYKGFVSLESDIFKNIVNNCAYVIVPSCAEGQCTSVLNCMNAGLVPIVTRECGIDINDNGFEINEINDDNIESIINNAISIDDESLKKMSYNVFKDIKENYSLENYYTNISKILSEILSD